MCRSNECLDLSEEQKTLFLHYAGHDEWYAVRLAQGDPELITAILKQFLKRRLLKFKYKTNASQTTTINNNYKQTNTPRESVAEFSLFFWNIFFVDVVFVYSLYTLSQRKRLNQ